MRITFTTLLCVLFTLSVSSQILLTEISYNPPESGTDSLEYVEIYNAGSDVNLSGYTFTQGFEYVFGDVTLAQGSYLLVAVDSIAMNTLFGVNAFQWTSGGLRNGGETIELQDGMGNVQFSIAYSDRDGWPGIDQGTDGGGATIELCGFDVDATDGANWFASSANTGIVIEGLNFLGTPGSENSASCADNSVVIEVSSNIFTPRDITVDPGTIVRWENKGGRHNVNGTMTTYPNNPESFSSGEPSSENWTYEFTFTMPGVYDYQCDPHVSFDMKGTVTVLNQSDVVPELVITEFMYNTPTMFDSIEFIEIYNAGSETVQMNGMQLIKDVEFTFPNLELPPGEFTFVALDGASFTKYFGLPAFTFTGGGLSSEGGEIILTSSGGDTIDFVNYLDMSPWPGGDGNGKSITLCDPASDNNDPSNWAEATVGAGFLYNGVEVFADPGRNSICLIPIGEATSINANGEAELRDQRVAIEGIVYGTNLRPQGLQFTLIGSDEEGIALFSGSENFGYAVQEGDLIRVIGRIGQFNGLTQITPDTVFLISSGQDLLSSQVVSELSEDTESELVTLENVMLVDPSDWGGGGSGFNADVTNGTDTFTIRIDADVDLFDLNYPTGTFSISGLGGQFDNSSPFDEGYQLLPRYKEDISPYVPFVEEFPARTIVEMSTVDADGVADSLDVKCSLTGIVYGINYRPSGLQFTIIDGDNNGIGLFNNTGSLDYVFNEGDEIEVKGSISQFNGLTQINPVSITLVSSDNPLVDPRMVSVLDESTESSLVQLSNVTFVDPTDWRGDGSSFNIELSDGAGNTFAMRIDSDNELANMTVPQDPLNVIGIGGQFDNSSPFTSGYQIFPRYASDLITVSSNEDILDESQIKIYPSPVEDLLFIESNIELGRIEIYDMGGRLQIVSKIKQVDVSNLIRGIYLVKLVAEEGSLIQKIIKK